MSIGQGGDDETGVSPEEIADRPSADSALQELIEDITTLLGRKERDLSLSLVRLFQAMLAGQRSEEQRKRFGDRGDRVARSARQVIVQAIREYAESTGNRALLNLLARLTGDDSAEPAPLRRALAKEAKPKLSAKQRDYASIVSVVERLDRPVGTADLGKYRRRWLGYPPRDSSSGHRNRMEEVLAQMIGDEVLRAMRSSRGAVLYAPGPNFDQYRATAMS